MINRKFWHWKEIETVIEVDMEFTISSSFITLMNPFRLII